ALAARPAGGLRALGGPLGGRVARGGGSRRGRRYRTRGGPGRPCAVGAPGAGRGAGASAGGGSVPVRVDIIHTSIIAGGSVLSHALTGPLVISRLLPATAFACLVLTAAPAAGQRPDSTLLTVDRLYGSAEFRPEGF